MAESMRDPYSKYAISAVVKATQHIEYNHDECSIEYGAIDAIIENFETQVYDTNDNVMVATFDGDMDEDELSESIKEAILSYENKKEEQ